MFRIKFLAVAASALLAGTASAQPGKTTNLQLGFGGTQFQPGPFGGVRTNSGFLNLGVNKPNGTLNLGIGGSSTQWTPGPFGPSPLGGMQSGGLGFNLGVNKPNGTVNLGIGGFQNNGPFGGQSGFGFNLNIKKKP